MKAKTLLKVGSPVGIALLALAALRKRKKGGGGTKDTERTKDVTSQLKKAGLTDKEIAKLRRAAK